MLNQDLTSKEAINCFISAMSDKLGYGKQCILSSEDIKDMMDETAKELFKVEMPKELDSLIKDFNNKFDEAYEARKKVIDYLEENYDVNSIEESENLEDENEWVYGLNQDYIEEIINDEERRSA